MDRSSTVIAKDPEGKQSTQSFYLINSFYFEHSRSSTSPASKSLAIEQQTQLRRASLKTKTFYQTSLINRTILVKCSDADQNWYNSAVSAVKKIDNEN